MFYNPGSEKQVSKPVNTDLQSVGRNQTGMYAGASETDRRK